MKTFVQLTLAAGLVAGSVASPHHHGHQHLHHKKADAVVDKRVPDPAVVYVAGPTHTAYVLDGKLIEGEEADKGIKAGAYIVVGETEPTFSAPPPPPKPTTTSSANFGAQFIEKSTSTTSTTSTSTTSSAPPPPPKPTTTSHAAPPPAKSQSSSDSSSKGATGLNAPFPDGEIDCSEFPSEYGAVAIDHLGFNGYSGIQTVPGFSLSDLSISSIVTGIFGSGCKENSMCSYNCPDGYLKTQWPEQQGNTGQSIGGLFCKGGKLHLTRKESETLCEAGVPGVSIQNDLNEEVCTCRTDYPGTESMVLPSCVQPGGSVVLANPNGNTYYRHQGDMTSAQYYINPAGLSASDACTWNSPVAPKSAGNWAAMNAGVGFSAGQTWVSIFPNAPTSSAVLEFKIDIIVDGSKKCTYSNGQFSGSVATKKGCTVGIPQGSKGVFRYY